MTRKWTGMVILLLLFACMMQAKEVVNVTIQTNYGNIELELWPDIAPKTVENFVGLAEGAKAWTAPNTGEQVQRPFYDGLIFHRVIKDFMIQGGCPIGNGTGGPGYRFEDETYEKGEQVPETLFTDEDANLVLESVVVPYLRAAADPKDWDPQLVTVLEAVQTQQSLEPVKKHPLSFYTNITGYTDKLYRHGKLRATVDYGTICMANSGPNTNGSQFFIVTKKDGCDWLNGKHTVFGKVTAGMDVVLAIGNAETDSRDAPKTPVVIQKVIVKK